MKKKTAVVPAKAKPLALPDYPKLMQGERATDAAYLERLYDWYGKYFLSAFRTFTRDEIGRRIHPADWIMQNQIGLLTCAVAYVPKCERAKFYVPLNILLKAIADKWPECTAPALGAQSHMYELERCNRNAEPGSAINIDEARRFVAKTDAERDGLKDNLRKLSETLLNANAARADEMLAAIEDVRGRVDAANVKLAAVGEDAKAARNAAERAADELAGWRQWLADNMNNQPSASTPRKRVVLKTLKPELGFAYVKNAITKVWRDFTAGVADCEPLGKWRKFGQQRSYGECLAIHGNEKIWNGHTLNDLLAVPESGKTPEEVFESIVHSGDETERQTRAKSKVRRKHSASAPQKRRRK